MAHADTTRWEKEVEPPTIILPRRAPSRLWRRLLNLLPGVELEVETKTYRGRLLSARTWEAWQQRWERFFMELTAAGAEGEVPDAFDDRWQRLLRSYLIESGFGSRVIVYVEGLPGGPRLMAGRFQVFDGPSSGSVTGMSDFPTASPTAGGDVDLVEGGPVNWFRPGPEQVDTGGSFSAGDDLETDGSGRAVQASSGTVVARALEGSSGAGDTAWVVLV